MSVLERQRKIWDRNFTLAWLCRFAFFFSYGMVQPTLPLYLDSLYADPARIGLVMAVFPLVATLFKPAAGYIMDRFGIRTCLVGALIIYAITPVGYALAWSFPVLILVRTFHGLSWSNCPPASIALASNLIPEKHRGEGLGTFLVSSNVAQALAAGLGVWLLAAIGPLGMFSTVSLVGAIALLFALLLPADKPALAKSSTPRITFRQYMRSILNLSTMGVVIPIFSLFFLTGGITAFLPLQARDLGLSNPGVYFSVYAAAIILSRPTMGGLSDRLGRNKVVIPSFLVLTATMALLAITSAWYWLLVAAVLHGLAQGSLQSVLIATLMDTTPPDRRGAALAQWGLGIELGMGTGSLLLGFVLSITGQSYLWMYTVCAIVTLVGLIAFVKLRPTEEAMTRSAD